MMALAGGVTGQSAPAAPAGDPRTPGAPEQSSESLLKDFIHYVRISRFDLAGAMAGKLLERNIQPRDFVAVVEGSGEADRFQESAARAMRVADLEPFAARLQKLFDDGKLLQVRDPDEITRNIVLLGTTQRGTLIARERLIAAGEYAMPQLLNALLQRANPLLQADARRVMVDMGRQAVIPLVTALPDLDPVGQQLVIDVLGLIPYRTSVPFLAELERTTTLDGVRGAARRAINKIAEAGQRVEEDAAKGFLELAEGFAAERQDLTSFPGEPFQLLWSFDSGIGLLMQAIATPVFHEAMAMRMAERSLTLQNDNPEAVGLWVASNFSRELDTPAGYTNPAYPADRRDAMYFAVAAGPSVTQRVLARGLDGRDTPLVLRSLEALSKTAGSEAIYSTGVAGRLPMLEALRYPSRRVQYEAALMLATNPAPGTFDGAERVVPTLASAVRDASQSFAVVLASDNERYQSNRAALEKLGYTVLPFGQDFNGIMESVAAVPGVDLVVLNLPAASADRLIAEARSMPKTAASPILALSAADAELDLGRKFARDASVMVRSPGIGQDTLGAAVTELVQTAAGGPISAEEAREYTARALGALRDIAISGGPVYSIDDAAQPLITVLGSATGQTRMQVADVLSRIGQKRVQVALADAALSATDAERVALLGKVAESARRFGNQLESRQITRLVELASTGSDDDATAAAGLMGSLNLPNAELLPLILNTKKSN